MDINQYFIEAVKGGAKEENILFCKLFEIFRAISNQHIRNREDAEDIAQSTVMKIAARYKTMTFNVSFSAYAYKILVNSIADYFQKSKRNRGLIEQNDFDENRGPGWTSDPIFEKQLLDCLKNLYRVNTRYARVLCLKYQGFSVEELCDRLEITPNNLYIILSRARSLLKKCLDDDEAL